MSPYSDASHSRPHLSRPLDSSSSSARDDVRSMKPSVGPASSSQRRVGEGTPNPPSPRANRHEPDPRYHYPPPPPPDHGRPTRLDPPRPPSRRYHAWPPQPSCEDEAVSLARETCSQSLLAELGKDEAQSRGTIDQEALIEDVLGFTDDFKRRSVRSESSRGSTRSTGIPTPPTSEDERNRKTRRKPSKLSTASDDTAPELANRKASPYSYTKPTKVQSDAAASSRFLTPEIPTPPPGGATRQGSRLTSLSTPSSPKREPVPASPSARKGRDYFSSNYPNDENAIDDDRWDTTDRMLNGNPRRTSRLSMAGERSKTTQHTSVHDFAPPPGNTASIRGANLDARRNTDTANTLPTLQKFQSGKTRRPSPLLAAGALGALNDLSLYSSPDTLKAPEEFPPRSREASSASSRGVSPASVASAHTDRSPARSPRAGYDPSRDQAPGSSPASRTGSVSNSRPSSPSSRPSAAESPRIPRTDLDWTTLLSANAARRSKPPSRLAASMRQESMPEMPRATNATPSLPKYPETRSSSSSLPYPDDDGPGAPMLTMPAEREHRYSSGKSGLTAPLTYEAQTVSPATSPGRSTSSHPSSRPSRPSLPMRHSVNNVPQVEDRSKAPESRPAPVPSSETRRELAALLKKGLPDCSRPYSVSGYDDWYTVIGAPQLEFCPDCITSVFERTVFRPSIRRSPPHSHNTKVRCVFGSSAWMRLAWLLTLQQQRTDFTLMKDLADIEETSEPCPGNREEVRSWYGLRDPDGLFVRDFHICYGDVRKIERVLPTLSGLFVRLPHRASYEKHICAIRSDGNRFSTYLDALITTHEKALAARQGADPMPLIDLVERKTRLRECTRDNLLVGALWHVAPALPALTVCADCFDAVVAPEIQRQSEVALRFPRAAQPVPGEGIGSSCQLYSPHMRRVFARAVRDRDVAYLARKAAERRAAELRLQDRYRDVVRRARRLSRDGGATEEDERRLNRELERITDEWKTNWE